MNITYTSILEKYADLIVEQMQDILIKNHKRATGNLINSITYKISDKEIVFYADDYGKFVKSGRKPGSKQPPLQPLINWLRVKKISVGGGKLKPMIKKGKISRKKGNTDSQIKGLAFVIARSIGKKGIKGLDYTAPIHTEKEKILSAIREYYINKIQGTIKK